ncbi:MAG: hypothetical protein ACREXW_03890 [Gammaproteobacteria bacterium]
MKHLVYLYHHLPKCGGVSFIDACSKWFPEKREQTGSYPTPEQTAEFAKTRLEFDALPPNCLVHGHLVRDGIRPFERYGDHIASGRCRLVMTVRDPLERHISAYYHRRKVGKEWPEPLERWLEHGSNQMAKYLGVDERNWKERLTAYFVVGTMEALQLTIDVFAAKTGNPRVKVAHLNTSPRDESSLSPATIELFKSRSPIDYRIFEYATQRLRDDAKLLGLL